jgi:hypothetical protein
MSNVLEVIGMVVISSFVVVLVSLGAFHLFGVTGMFSAIFFLTGLVFGAQIGRKA